LDLETLNILEKVLQDFGGSIIVISHDRLFLKNITNRLLVLESGQVEIFEGGYDQAEAYLEAKALEETLRDEEASNGQSKESSPRKEGNSGNDSGHKVMTKIEELEDFIAKIDQVMQDIGSSQQTSENLEKLVLLSKKKESKEEELLKLYEKVEN